MNKSIKFKVIHQAPSSLATDTLRKNTNHLSGKSKTLSIIAKSSFSLLFFLLVHAFFTVLPQNLSVFIDPLGQPTAVTVGMDNCFFAIKCRPSVRQSPLFQQNKTKRKQCSLLARLWVWPSGSLVTPVLYYLLWIVHDLLDVIHGEVGHSDVLGFAQILETLQSSPDLQSGSFQILS